VIYLSVINLTDEQTAPQQPPPPQIVPMKKEDFLRPSGLIVIALRDGPLSATDMTKKTGLSYVYTTQLNVILIAAGMIEVQKAGRKKIHKLTQKGEHMAMLLKGVIDAV
jgi:predicted transcriptional regulator